MENIIGRYMGCLVTETIYGSTNIILVAREKIPDTLYLQIFHKSSSLYSINETNCWEPGINIIHTRITDPHSGLYKYNKRISLSQPAWLRQSSVCDSRWNLCQAFLSAHTTQVSVHNLWEMENVDSLLCVVDSLLTYIYIYIYSIQPT